MNRYEIDSPSWQSLLGQILKDYMVGKGFDIANESLYLPKDEDAFVHEPEALAASAHNSTTTRTKTKVAGRHRLDRENIEAVFLTRRRDQRGFFPADGLDCLSRHNLLLFNPQPLEPAYLQQMTDYFWGYARFPSGKVRPSSPVFMVISPSASEGMNKLTNLKPIMPGVYEYNDLLSHFLVLIIDQLMDIPENALWGLFSFDAEKVRHALSQYRPNQAEGKLHLPTLVEKYVAAGVLEA